MERVYIVAAKRTAVGSFLGALKDVKAPDLAAPLVKQILADTKVPAADIDELILGNILPAGVGQGPGRQVALKGGLPQHIPASSLNMACGSAMKAMMNAYASIRGGVNHLVLAGGAESMSNAPYLVSEKVRSGVKFGDFKLVDHMVYDALTDAFHGVHMGITAENIAEKYNISREEQDEFAITSQQRAIAAVDAGKFKEEIVPLTIKAGKVETVFDTDEYPNRSTSLAKLSTLRPAFKKEGGTVTAGNASGLNDGASMVLIASESAVKKYNLKPLVEIVGIGQGGVDPLYMGLGPTPAIQNALKSAGLKFSDIDLFELNEAFAAQSLGVLKELEVAFGVSKDEMLKKTNLNGGAIALGHAVGSSGGRITVTLLHEMRRQGLKYGLATLCIGGGMGTAIILKTVA